jgi:DNA-binding SARP family transcriptional activator
VSLEFRILGPLEVLVDDRPLPVGGRRQRALLTALLLQPRQVVPTEQLISDLWGDEPPKTAATSLHNLVSQLRKQVGADVLVTQAPGYVLRVPSDRIDAYRFERALADARRLRPADRRDHLEGALGMWRGPPLAEFAFDDFAQPEIRRLGELRLVAVGERIEADLELGRHGDLVGELEGLVQTHPLREPFRRQLMLALYRSGRQAEALGAYQHARRQLLDELGLEPFGCGTAHEARPELSAAGVARDGERRRLPVVA